MTLKLFSFTLPKDRKKATSLEANNFKIIFSRVWGAYDLEAGDVNVRLLKWQECEERRLDRLAAFSNNSSIKGTHHLSRSILTEMKRDPRDKLKRLVFTRHWEFFSERFSWASGSQAGKTKVAVTMYAYVHGHMYICRCECVRALMCTLILISWLLQSFKK